MIILKNKYKDEINLTLIILEKNMSKNVHFWTYFQGKLISQKPF